MNATQFCINFVLAVLATWRVTHLLANEDGPADLVVKFRALLGDSLAGHLMDCFKCLSLWIAAPAAFFVTRVALQWLFVWLAISGAACLLQRLVPESAETQAAQLPRDNSFNSRESKDSDGETSHVLWSETFSSAERTILGDNSWPGKVAHRPDTNKTALNGTHRA